jgi:hypothetical protein
MPPLPLSAKSYKVPRNEKQASGSFWALPISTHRVGLLGRQGHPPGTPCHTGTYLLVPSCVVELVATAAGAWW